MTRQPEGVCPVCGLRAPRLRMKCAMGHAPVFVEPIPDDRLFRRVAKQLPEGSVEAGCWYWTYVAVASDERQKP